MVEGDVDTVIQMCQTSLTVFLGGAGMAGGYNDEFIQVFREAGICNPVYGNFSGPGWTDNGLFGVEKTKPVDMLGDAASVIFFNQSALNRWHYFYDGAHWWYNPTRREDQWVRLDTSPAHMRIAKEGNYSLAKIGVSNPVPEKRDQFNLIGYSWAR